MHVPDSTSLRDKAVLVTGGTTGIGLAIARALVGAEARVLIFGRHKTALEDALKEIGREGEVHGMLADAASETDLADVFASVDAKLGGLDILINNAGLDADPLLEGRYSGWKYTLDTNVLAYIACARYAVERMKKAGGGHIVNIGSVSAESRGADGEIYVASKSAVRGFSQSSAKTLQKDKIRVTLIEPGATASDMMEDTPAEQAEAIAKGEMLKADDIAAGVLYCLTRPERCNVNILQLGPLLSGEE